MKENNHSRWIEQIKKITSIDRKLRSHYYKTHSDEIIEYNDSRAFGGAENESIGPWPEFNLRGIHCRKSDAGLCTPCFYSKFANIIGVSDSREKQIAFIKKQIDEIIDNFDGENGLSNLFNNGGDKKIAYDVNQMYYKENKPMAICLTPVGSFFEDEEMYPEVREYVLDRLLEKSDYLQRDVILYVEAHVNDFLKFFKKDESEIANQLEKFQRLHLRVVFGFESSDEYVRNVLYCKGLELSSFEKAVLIAKEHNIVPYAFVFIGLYPLCLDDKKLIADAKKSMDYLYDKEVVPVVMFANVQPYTINDLFVYLGEDVIMEPRTVLTILDYMLDKFGIDFKNGVDPWLFADPVGGPPEPKYHIFKRNEINSIVTCDKCTEEIYKIMLDIRKDYDLNKYKIGTSKIRNCECTEKYNQYLTDRENNTDLIELTDQMIEKVEKHIDDYLDHLEREEILNTKAGLLCHGVRIEGEELRRILSEPPYSLVYDFIHSINIEYNGYYMNVFAGDKYTKDSPYYLTYTKHNNKDIFNLHCEDEFLGNVSFLKLPNWCYDKVNEIIIGDYLRPHSDNCISIWPNQNCCLEKHCKFCSLFSNQEALPVDTVVQMICHALEEGLKENKKYEVNIGGGILKDYPTHVKYFTDIVKGVKQKYDNKISVETIVPITEEDLKSYKEAGVDTILMNFEIADEEKRKEICPTKGMISRDWYFNQFKEAVNLFGKWHVASVLIVGLSHQLDNDIENEKNKILECANEMIKLGVMPILMPFQPLTDCSLSKLNKTDQDYYIEVSNEIQKILYKNMFSRDHLEGCVKCGGCSLENIK